MNYNAILKTICQKGNTGNVMEVLGWDISRFEEGFQLALEMDNLNYVKLIYSNINKNVIVVELTLAGEEATKR